MPFTRKSLFFHPPRFTNTAAPPSAEGAASVPAESGPARFYRGGWRKKSHCMLRNIFHPLDCTAKTKINYFFDFMHT